MIIDDKYISLEEKVFLELEDEILSGKLTRGTTLTEISVSKRLGVSRTPVRSALHKLTEDGLVRQVPNRGTVVVGITEEDLVDIYRIRVRLEGLASAIAAEKISDEGLKKLTESVELAEFYIDRKNTEKLKELDSEFHETIYKETGNRLLCKTLSELHRKIKSYRKLSLSVPGRLECSVSEHREILEAIQARDSEAADRLTSRHIEEALANMMKAIENNKKEC
ncbi:MAG: GntR family transcriptional regulator [Clostridia bacterium]|nr:GntR family transcriptional regulator [Clostridia bacterium]